MTTEENILWKNISDFEIDEPDSSLMFTDRLAKENGWSIEYSLRAVEEYKKFIFLICASNLPQTPSDQVDQVWHLHLLYTQSYWIDFCHNTIGKQIHHGPTKGGKEETGKYSEIYENTLKNYTVYFKQIPPSDLWPSSQVRFSDIHFRRVNLKKNWILNKTFPFTK